MPAAPYRGPAIKPGARELELAQSGSRFTTRLRTLREGDEGTEGKAVSFETGSHPRTGKIKAISVDLN
jgi:hypothetical protein